MDMLHRALDYVFTAWFFVGALCFAHYSPLSSAPSHRHLIGALWSVSRAVVVVGGCWALPAPLACACAGTVAMVCVLVFSTLASHIAADICFDADADPDSADAKGLRVPADLDAALLETLPVLPFHRAISGSSTLSTDSCCICLADYSEGVQLRKLRCCHVFHASCIDEWFRQRPTCPLCKHDIRTASGIAPPMNAVPSSHNIVS